MPKSTVDLPKLKELSIYACHISDQSIQCLINKSTNLLKIDFEDYDYTYEAFNEVQLEKLLTLRLEHSDLNENPNDIGSSDNKRSIVEKDQSSTVSGENKKSRIVIESETNVDNITNKNVNSNNK